MTHGKSDFESKKFCNACPTISAAPETPTPHCKGRREEHTVLAEELLQAYLATMRRRVSPTAIGLIEMVSGEESGFFRAIRRAEHRNGEKVCGIFPDKDQ